MKKISLFATLIYCLLLTGFALSAVAAQLATVDVDGTELFVGPRKNSPVIRKLKKGMKVAASNYATEGFFKVRTGKSEVGWVKADVLILEQLPDEGDGSKAGGKR